MKSILSGQRNWILIIYLASKKTGDMGRYNGGFCVFDLTLNSYKYIDNISVYDKSEFVDCLKKEWIDEDGQILSQHIQLIRLGRELIL